MKTVAAIFAILLSPALPAADAPTITPGDYLLVYAQIVECGSDPQAIEAAQVNEDGVLTLFGDATLVAQGKSVHQVRHELLDEMERRTGHRSKTLELVYVPGNNQEATAKRLVRFAWEVKQPCPPEVLPPFHPDPNRAKVFEKLVRSDRSSPHQPAATNSFGAKPGEKS